MCRNPNISIAHPVEEATDCLEFTDFPAHVPFLFRDPRSTWFPRDLSPIPSVILPQPSLVYRDLDSREECGSAFRCLFLT